MRNNIIKYLITVLSGLSLLMAGSCNNDTDSLVSGKKS